MNQSLAAASLGPVPLPPLCLWLLIKAAFSLVNWMSCFVTFSKKTDLCRNWRFSLCLRSKGRRVNRRQSLTLTTSVNLTGCLITLIGLVKALSTNDSGEAELVSQFPSTAQMNVLERHAEAFVVRDSISYFLKTVSSATLMWIVPCFSCRAGCCPVGWMTARSRATTRSG